MKQRNNTPNVLEPIRKQIMVQQGDSEKQCEICGSESEVTHIAIVGDEEELADVPEKRIVWICEHDYKTLQKSKEFRIRELPEEIELNHDARQVIHEGGYKMITILEKGHENKWLQIPEGLEEDLSDNL